MLCWWGVCDGNNTVVHVLQKAQPQQDHGCSIQQCASNSLGQLRVCLAACTQHLTVQ